MGAGRDRRRSVDGPGAARYPVLAVARFEAARRGRTTLALVAVLVLLGGLYLALAPDLVTGGAYAELVETLPPVLRSLFGLEGGGSVVGLLAGEYYTFAWVLGLAGYLAYAAAGTVAGDRSTGRLDTLLAAPVSRTRLLLGKYLALLVPVVVTAVVVPVALAAGARAVGTPVAVSRLAALHVLAVPYLLCWGAVGLLAGVTIRRRRRAGRAAVGLVVGAWLVESVLATTELAWAGAVLPPRHLDPVAVLVDGTYDLVGAASLLLGTVGLLVVAVLAFRRRDL